MMLPTITIFFVEVAALIFAAYVFLVSVPGCMRSRVRYRLWALRDQIVDDLIAGKLDGEYGMARGMIWVIENSLEHSNQLTFLSQIARGTRSRRPNNIARENRVRVAKHLKQLPSEQRRLLRDYRNEYNLILTDHMFAGSLAGWIAIATLFVWFLGYLIVTNLVKLAKVNHPVRIAVDRSRMEATVYTKRHVTDRQPWDRSASTTASCLAI